MSGQWEVVGKTKQTKNGQSKKLTKNEKKKFVENAPKVEDILPIAQVKSLYTSLDNKENKKPPVKETPKENGTKKPQKKPQPEKKKEVREKPPVPKSIEMAVKAIDVKELRNELLIGKARFQDAPLVWLKGLAEYLNVKLNHTHPVTNHKSNEYPLCAMSGDIRDVLKQALKEAGEAPIEHFFQICLSSIANELSRGSSLIYGYKVMVQFMAFQKPSITVSNIPKLTSLCNSYQNRQPIGLAILWAVGQGGIKDTQVGLKVWLEVMLPMLELKHYTSAVVSYLKDILIHTPANKAITQGQFFAVLDVIHSSTNLPNNQKQELLALSAPLRIRILKDSEKNLRNLFEPLLVRLQPSASKPLRDELLICLMACLNRDQHCFNVWRQLYAKHIPQSSILLAHLDSHYNKIKGKVAVKILRETLSTFRDTNNEELKRGKHKELKHIQSCQQACEELLKKMTVTRSFPWKLASFFLLLAIIGLLSYDIQKHGSFCASSTGIFLNDIGAVQYGEIAWAKTRLYSQKSYRWAEANVPHYYKVVSDHAKPYLELAWDVCLVVGLQLRNMYENTRIYIEEKTPLVIEWVNHYAPGLLDKVKLHSIELWEVVKYYALLLWQYFLQYSYLALEWVQTNVFVGSLSPENLHKYSMEALNTTQVYAVWTYDWVCRKVQTLSKIQ